MHDEDDDGGNGFRKRSQEVTRRTRLINAVASRQDNSEDRAERAEAALKRIWLWLQIIGGIASAVAIGTFGIAKWMSNVAHTAELSNVETRVTVVETKMDLLTKMMEMNVQQNKEIARTVHAPMVVTPEAIKLDPPKPTEPK